MEIRRGRVASGIRAIVLLIVWITISATVALAMLIDTLTVPTPAVSAPLDCAAPVHPVVHTIKSVESRC
jgi:hypothetical protein